MEWNNGVTTAKYAYIQDLQGDIVGIVDSDGTEVVKYTYDAWGKILSTSGSLAATLGTIQPFRYRGYVYDVETGLYYLRARYYNPTWQRFTNADYIFDANVKLGKFNQYIYCDNNPIIYSDHEGKGLFTSLVIGFVVGAIVGGVAAAIKGESTEDILVSALAGGVSGAISVIPIPGINIYLSAAITGAIGNVASRLITGDISSLEDTLVALGVGAVAGTIGQMMSSALFKGANKYWNSLTRNEKKSIISNLGKVDQSKVNIVYKEIRDGVTEDTISYLIKEYGMDVVLSTIVSSAGTSY